VDLRITFDGGALAGQVGFAGFDQIFDAAEAAVVPVFAGGAVESQELQIGIVFPSGKPDLEGLAPKLLYLRAIFDRGDGP
jgi:hypothetical protein